MANQNVTQLTQQTTSANTSSLFYAVTGGTTDTGLPFSVLVNNLGLTGTPTAPTATGGTNTTQIATTAFVQTTVGAYAPLASPTFTGTVVIPTVTLSGGTINGTAIGGSTPSSGAFTTVSATGLITPSTTNGIKGTTLADSANTGSVGEFVSATTLATSLTTATVTNATSVTLTAGDWDIAGQIQFHGTTVVLTTVLGSISTTSGSLGAFGTLTQQTSMGTPVATSQTWNLPLPVTRINVSTSTTVYVVVNSVFSSGTLTVDGFINARRVR